jgi:glucose/arabinose dehydrogenase
VAAIGMRFYDGKMFPEKYRHGVFIAEHGSWNRSKPIGYRVTFVKVEDGKATSYEPFAAGWLKGSTASGRPADVLVMPDGALLVSDDKAGRIYRITYEGAR